MRDILKLILLQIKIWFNSVKYATKTERIRILLLSVICSIFVVGCYIISYQVVIYISTLPVIGTLFTVRILALAFLSSFVMLIFSSLIVTLSTVYSQQDCNFLFSLPLNSLNIFMFKSITAYLYSSWMIIIILIPFVTGFVVVKKILLTEYILLIVCLFLGIYIMVSIGSMISVFLSYLFPSKKVKNIVLVSIIILASVGYSILRFSEPEKLLSPEKFSELVKYLDFMEKPVARWFPSWWVTEIFRGFVVKNMSLVTTNFIKLFVLSVMMYMITRLVGAKLFYTSYFSFEKSGMKNKKLVSDLIFVKNQSLLKTIMNKEIKLLTREPIQWVQLVVVVALSVIYLFNINKLPIDFEYLRTTVAFFNLGGVMFIMTAIVLRFIFVQPSLEYKTFWLVKSLPVDIFKFFIIKFIVYFPIIFLPSVIIVGISNLLLCVEKTFFMFCIIVIIIASVVLSISGYSMGILFPKKEYKDIAEIETSFGGLIFIILSLCYIILLLASVAEPVRRYVLGHSISLFEVIFYTILFLAINFIYAFTTGYYAIKKFKHEY